MNWQYPYYGTETQCKEVPITFPPQHQYRQPGLEYLMVPRPIYDNPKYIGTGKLLDRVAIISGGDSGIGRAVAVALPKKGPMWSLPISMSIEMLWKPVMSFISSADVVC